MKKLILLLAFVPFLAACNPAQRRVNWGVEAAQAATPGEVVYEGCEYLVFPGTRGVTVTHKGNCSSPYHKLQK
jgi:hypothetical protein